MSIHARRPSPFPRSAVTLFMTVVVVASCNQSFALPPALWDSERIVSWTPSDGEPELWFTSAPGAIGSLDLQGSVVIRAFNSSSFPDGDATFTVPPSGLLEGLPGPLAVGADNNLYVTQRITPSEMQLLRISPARELVPFATVPFVPNQMVAGPDGNFWLYAANTSVIYRQPIDPNGQLQSFDTDHLHQPGTAILALTGGPDGNVWFAKLQNGTTTTTTLCKMSPTGGPITEYPIPSGAPHVNALVAGNARDLWFTEDGGNKGGAIGHLDVDTGLIQETPLPNPTVTPRAIVAHPDGNFYFTELTDQIGKITPDFVITEQAVSVALMTIPSEIAVGPDLRLYYTEADIFATPAVPAIGVIAPFGDPPPPPPPTAGP